jgi:hypothetical protein
MLRCIGLGDVRHVAALHAHRCPSEFQLDLRLTPFQVKRPLF